MLRHLDIWLDKITMYRLLLYYLIALVVAALGLSLVGDLHMSALSIIESVAIVLIACLVVNEVLAAIFKAPTNFESTYITALILVLIITPPNASILENITFLLAASGLAMASKYILTVNRKHIFNPAAIAVVLTALGPRQSASWWVGTSVMLPFVLIGGLILIRKIRRGRMVPTFFATTLLATVVYSLMSGTNAFSALDNTVTTSAMFFLGFVMLTEPLTTPPTARKQTWYAVLMGVLFPPQFHILSLYSTPELALVASNIFSFLTSPRVKLFPTLTQKIRIAPDSVDFVFNPHRQFAYEPGQYMEWTLPHGGRDSRGDRRYFTLSSSPTEPAVRIGVKFYDHSSSYKKALLKITQDTPIAADHISGDFTMPKDDHQKLAFIAGGIGVTPFRSMIKYLIDKHEPRDITLLYSARTKADFAYSSIFEQARPQLGIKTIYVLTDEDAELPNHHSHHGRIGANLIKDEMPDFLERTFYISGTRSMVESMRGILGELGVPKKQVKVDYFSGYS